VFEAVGDVPRAVEAVGAEGPVGAQEADRQEAGEDAERGQQDQPQFRGWGYELDPRYARSPAPTPEPEPEEEQVPEGAGRFVTRSGRQWGLISNATNDYEAELDDDYLGRPGKDEYHPSDTRIPLWSGDFSPHSLAALALQAVGGVEPRSWREAIASVDAKQWQAAAHDEMRSLIKAGVFRPVPRSIAQGRVVTSKTIQSSIGRSRFQPEARH